MMYGGLISTKVDNTRRQEPFERELPETGISLSLTEVSANFNNL